MARRSGRRPANVYEAAVYDYDRNEVVLDQGFHQSDNSQGFTFTAITTQPKEALSSLADAYATWQPFSNSCPTTTNPACPSQSEEGSDDDDVALFDDPPKSDDEASTAPGDSGQKRKRYASSDNPNSMWRENALTLLNELYRFDGLGSAHASPCCVTCGSSFSTGDIDPVRLFRCEDCHPLLECQSCLLDRHHTSPLHRIQEWNGSYFTSTTLSSLGLIYQLGHGGLPCLSPDTTTRKMVIIHTNGIHEVQVQFCDCTPIHKPSHVQQLMRAGWYPATTTDPRTCATFEVLDLYRELNVRATVNADDFVKVLVGRTNMMNATDVPERYRVFSRMARQWAFLHRVKRSGVGLVIKHINDIEGGSLAVLCWACPHLGINLPSDWEKSKYSYLHMPIVSIDANFRLKCRLRKNERPDPALSPGSAYFVDPAPYKEHLKNYVSETDVSTCIAFAALLEKDTKLTTGLKTSGVVGCACSRHEIIRPLGLGDLQKGERYANVDYVFWSAIKSFGLPRLGVSYDIICQWKTHLLERLKQLPEDVQINPDDIEFTFGLPTWHAIAHALSCRACHSLTYQDGVGRTDGEGIERIWSLLNPSSYATKEMGEGSRHDSIDDRVDHHNFMKNIALGDILARRLKDAIEERDRQVESFRLHDRKLKPDLRRQWLQQIIDWKADRTLPSPFLLTAASNGPSEEDVRKELENEEKEEQAESQGLVRGTSASAFLVAGLELEDLQLKIQRDASKKNLTAAEAERLEERRHSLLYKLKAFRELQHIYTPGAFRMEDASHDQPSSSPLLLPNAEDIKLWLPSDFSFIQRSTACVPDLAYQEARLREGRCNDALVSLRHFLHAKRYLLAFRNANVAGQYESTRARTVIDNTGAQVDTEARKYRKSRQALLSLYDTDSLDDYPPLEQSDITLEQITDEDLLSLVKLGKAKGKGSKSQRRQHIPTGKNTLSWIWTAQGGPTEHEAEGLVETVRVEWSKAYERKNRWSEEVETLREEMSRVEWWQSMMPPLEAASLHHPAAAIAAGIRSYTARQSALLHQVAARFRTKWGLE